LRKRKFRSFKLFPSLDLGMIAAFSSGFRV
jgi:hypothetical protein